MRSRSVLVAVLATALLLAACGRDKEQTAPDNTSGGAAATTAPSGSASPLDRGGFGDLGVVCSPAPAGEPNAASTEPGVTATSVQLGTFSDPGFAGRLGLNKELFDTAEAFTKWCNAHGGIHGRQIVLKERDAKVLEFQQRVIEACDQHDFYVVGGGAVFDDTGQADRLKCGLPAVPGYTVTPGAAEADLSVQPVPIRNDEAPVGTFRYLLQKFPATKGAVGIFTGSVPTTKTVAARNKEALGTLGAKVVYNGTYNSTGETSWRPFLDSMRTAGVKGLYFVGDPGVMSTFLSEAASLGQKFDWIAADPNNYDPSLVAPGAAINGVYVRTAFYPFLDEAVAKQNPATEQYREMMAKYDPQGKIAYLGVQGLSAWLLFAKAADKCGATLTRDCVWKNATAITDWTGGGLQAKHDLKDASASDCTAILAVTNGKFALAKGYGANDGIWNCNPKNVVQLHGDYGTGAKCPNPAYADDPKPSTCAVK
jgi:ABC-type branched-subunit amino acid transport system substrate-binding protein